MKRITKALLGLGAFAPILSSIGLGVYIAVRLIIADIESGGTSPDLVRVLMNSPLEASESIAFAVIIGFVVLLQISLAVVFAIHASRDPRLGNAGKALWIVGFFVIGSLALPAYFLFFVLRDPPPKREAALDRPPIAS